MPSLQERKESILTQQKAEEVRDQELSQPLRELLITRIKQNETYRELMSFFNSRQNEVLAVLREVYCEVWTKKWNFKEADFNSYVWIKKPISPEEFVANVPTKSLKELFGEDFSNLSEDMIKRVVSDYLLATWRGGSGILGIKYEDDSRSITFAIKINACVHGSQLGQVELLEFRSNLGDDVKTSWESILDYIAFRYKDNVEYHYYKSKPQYQEYIDVGGA